MDKEFRAYDKKQNIMVYNQALWLPKGLKKLGHKEFPVHVTDKGIRYTLNCLSNHYENDWEEDVVTRYDIEIMQFTNYWDCGEPKQKIYAEDLISFYLSDDINVPNSSKMIGKVILNEEIQEWIVVSKEGKFIEMLSRVVQPKVIGNWLDHPVLLN